MGLTDTLPVATTLGPTHVSLVTRAKPEPVTRKKTTEAGNLLYRDIDEKETTKSETVVTDPKTKEIIRRYQHEPIIEEVTDEDGNQVYDYVERVSINQPLTDDDGKAAGSRSGDENDLPADLRAEWADLIKRTREAFADVLDVKAWRD